MSLFLDSAALTPDLTVIAAAVLIYAALHDVAVRTVPNWVSLAVFAMGCCIRLADHSLFYALMIAGATFIVLFTLWALGAMGGGDVKLWSAAVMLIPPMLQPELQAFLRVVVLGGVLALFYLLARLFIRKPAASRQGGLLRRILRTEAWRIGRRAPLPYACAIAGGMLCTILPLTLQR